MLRAVETFKLSLQHPAMLEQLIKYAAALLTVCAIAVTVGYLTGNEMTFVLYLGALGSVIAMVTVGLKRRVWMLLILAWPMARGSGFLPDPFCLRDVGVLLAVVTVIAYRIISRTRTKIGWHFLDVILLINIAYLAFTFIHNPVGVWFLKSEKVGGRPYFNIIIVLLAYWVITRLPDESKKISRIPLFLIGAQAFQAFLYVVGRVAPGAAGKLSYLYSGAGELELLKQSGMMGPGENRWTGVGFFGMALVVALCAYYVPRSLLNPTRKRFWLFLFGVACILASGFRNLVLLTGMAFLIGSFFHRGWREVWLTALLAGILYLVLATGQGTVFNLPLSVQRSLAWLPGNWSQEAVASGERSSEERFEWWKNIIKYKIIKDWWFGDGFGFSTREAMAMVMTGYSTLEWATAAGSLHNGPLSTIRYVGIVGLILFYGLAISAAVFAGKFALKCRGSPLQPLAIFLAMQMIWFPIHYTLVFGAYNTDLLEQIFLIALLRLVIRKNEEAQPAKATAAIPHRGFGFSSAPAPV